MGSLRFALRRGQLRAESDVAKSHALKILTLTLYSSKILASLAANSVIPIGRGGRGEGVPRSDFCRLDAILTLSITIKSMAESECSAYKALKDREARAHAAWTSFLYRNEVKPKISEKTKRKHQKEEMEAYQRAHKARLAHEKTCPTCKKSDGGTTGVSPVQ
jgi:hypothetical protein